MVGPSFGGFCMDSRGILDSMYIWKVAAVFSCLVACFGLLSFPAYLLLSL